FTQLYGDLSNDGLFTLLHIQRCCGGAGACSPPGVRTEIASSGLILGVIKKSNSLVVLTVAVSLNRVPIKGRLPKPGTCFTLTESVSTRIPPMTAVPPSGMST